MKAKTIFLLIGLLILGVFGYSFCEGFMSGGRHGVMREEREAAERLCRRVPVSERESCIDMMGDEVHKMRLRGDLP